ncbi:MAG: class C sortase [Oscillospiraceae bacterium]
MKKKNKKSAIITVVLVVFLLVGLSVMLYPTFSDWYNESRFKNNIANYDKVVSTTKKDDIEKMFKEAEGYNEKLKKLASPLTDYDNVPNYDKILDITGTGIMGYISIPKIKMEVPIYHGTSVDVLNIAAGHLEGTTLPIGGKGNHAVISAHRGLVSSKLFTDIDKLREGDYFSITVLNRVMYYEVDQIKIVLPDNVTDLYPVSGEDYVTLMTCTPLGINTHRLLVRGHRISSPEGASKVNVTSDAVQVDPMLVIPYIAIPLLILLIVYWHSQSKREKHNRHTALEKYNKSKNRTKNRGGP